jgi:hypothetical protein
VREIVNACCAISAANATTEAVLSRGSEQMFVDKASLPFSAEPRKVSKPSPISPYEAVGCLCPDPVDD